MRFLVLGPLEVMDDGGQLVQIAGAKERALLAHLIANADRVVPADDLIDELWGENPPRTAARTLRSYVSRLRRSLDPDRSAEGGTETLRSRGDGYELLADGHQIDAARFEALAREGHRLLGAGNPSEADVVLDEALDLWRGAAYQGFRYTGFGGSEGERLEELRRAAIEDRIDARLADGGTDSLVADLEGMVREEPLRERRWGQLMLALYRAGRQAEALQAFTRARAVLVDELGIEPGPDLQRVQAAILAHDPALDREVPGHPASAPAVDVCPYKGLARYETDDAEFFFGREHVVAEAIGHLVGGRFLALVGASGSGKSSLLRAGLLHALRSGALPGSDRWAYSVIRPGADPQEQLDQATRQLSDAGHSVIAVDQFEEIFTAGADDTERQAFFDALTRTVLQPEGRVTIVIAMRADFYGRCAKHRAFASLLASDQILVGPMDEEELRRAIVLPAEHAGLSSEEALVDVLVADTLDQPGALPLLSTALLELWTRRRDRTLSLDEYLRSGGVEGAVARLAEDAYGRLGRNDQTAAKRILLRLAASGEGSEMVRRRAPIEEFDLSSDQTMSDAMAVLADARLVTFSDGTVEVSHEALLHEWPRLRTWLEDDAEGRKLHRHLTESSHTWDEGGRDAADLYRGARLTAAWEWAETYGADLNDLERAFLRASHAASEGEAVRARRTNRRLRGLLAGVAVLLAASLVIGDLALTQRDRATEALTLADAGRLASRSRLEADPQLALLMAREAVSIDDSPETHERTVRGAGTHAGDHRPDLSPRRPVRRRRRDGNGSRSLRTGGRSRSATPDRRSSSSMRCRQVPIGAVDVGSGTERAAFSPDGKTLAIVTSAGDLVAGQRREPNRARSRSSGGHRRRDRVRPTAAASSSPLSTAPICGRSSCPATRSRFEPTGRQIPTPGRAQAVFPQISAPLALFAMAFGPDGSLVTTRFRGPTVLWSPGLTMLSTLRHRGAGGRCEPGWRRRRPDRERR